MKHDSKVIDLNTLFRLEIDYSDKEHVKYSNALLEVLLDPRAPTNIVRELSVTGFPSLGNWTSLTEIFERISDLQDVYWAGEKAIPKQIVTALEEKNPSCRLHYTLSFINWDRFAEGYIPIQAIGEEPHHESRGLERESIVGSENLYALKTTVEYGGMPNLEDLDLVFRILVSCQKMKELDLSINREGCEFSDTPIRVRLHVEPSGQVPSA